jgi:hypothetical protein
MQISIVPMGRTADNHVCSNGNKQQTFCTMQTWNDICKTLLPEVSLTPKPAADFQHLNKISTKQMEFLKFSKPFRGLELLYRLEVSLTGKPIIITFVKVIIQVFLQGRVIAAVTQKM